MTMRKFLLPEAYAKLFYQKQEAYQQLLRVRICFSDLLLWGGRQTGELNRTYPRPSDVKILPIKRATGHQKTGKACHISRTTVYKYIGLLEG